MSDAVVSSRLSSVTVPELRASFAREHPPIVIDVRKASAFRDAGSMITGALRRDPEQVEAWARSLPAASAFVVYCVHGREVSQGTARALAGLGISVRYLEGGLEAWGAAGGALDAKPRGASTRWITRERPKIDRIACPWLVARFVDRDAEFLYVPTTRVLAAASENEAIPYDIPDVHFSHEGERCSFDAFVRHFRLGDPALHELALIVRAADTANLGIAPQAAGLAAISLGLSRNFPDDHEMLGHGMVMYDALYSWCKQGKEEVHTWNPQAYR
ncbi:MAG TPA: chromate resistance protein ChrB domain-containing protein [Usitatibacter sp.]|jgi:rhodanese-related sulfurtransferase|nr:chromate resistance protein ChrB domain-containing protein [Usitatibacter sp.]